MEPEAYFLLCVEEARNRPGADFFAALDATFRLDRGIFTAPTAARFIRVNHTLLDILPQLRSSHRRRSAALSCSTSQSLEFDNGLQLS